jgi:hypothetical protein
MRSPFPTGRTTKEPVHGTQVLRVERLPIPQPLPEQRVLFELRDTTRQIGMIQEQVAKVEKLRLRQDRLRHRIALECDILRDLISGAR